MRTSSWPGGSFARQPDRRLTWDLEIKLLTPMFGGGVTAEGHKRPVDPVTPIRVPSIRGQLRFWWRAVNRQGCETIEQLRRAESEIFGAASHSGRLDLQVIGAIPTSREYEVLEGKFGAKKGLEGLAYGAFPLRDTDKGDTLNHGVLTSIEKSFSLRASFPDDVTEDVASAMWAWLAFGGLGGRTRRGFGAVEVAEGPAEVTLGVEDGWRKYGSNFGPRRWPTLPAELRYAWREVNAAPGHTPTHALSDLLGRFQKLRQGEGLGRTKRRDGTKNPGRSYWPEADSIRDIQGRTSSMHRERLTRVPEFPRAAFGTPIIFHFKDEGDPSDSTLNPVGRGRLASPLLFRPARLPGGQLVLRALRLEHPPPPDGFELTWNGNRSEPVKGRSADPDWGLKDRQSPLVTDTFHDVDPIARFFEELQK